ncbi:MAG: Gfo/Idh/MocA family oxidoreductase [Armatimonadetes bacterium]|nr:Gfo/Idh/MocA family oxidoreductase [Armatimonadota bacterium]
MRIGVVDLDTSHPQNWIPIERELGHEVIGVWDSGAIHPAGYAEKFAADHRIPRVFASYEDMVPEVDCAIIHGCDWDTHIAKARPFIEAGKAILLDKPMTGKSSDLEQLVAWEKEGARISGGSSLRFCFETQDWLSKPVEERGRPHTALCGCAVDEFNYGIHAYSMLIGIMGGGAQSVRHLGRCGQRRIQVNWPDGRMGFLVIGAAAGWIPFYASVATDKGAVQYQADAEQLYRALLEATLPYLSGQTDSPPVPMSDLILPELCALAARQSWMNDNAEVSLENLEDRSGYDGRAFAEGYRKARYPSG